jgi:UPF0716 protein FxsA
MLWVVLLLVVGPLLELFVIFQVAHVVGGWQTIGLLILESMVGAWLLKRQGLSALSRVTQALEQGRIPGKELVDGFLIMVAGALMIAPGFLTDAVGYLLLLPPTRAPVRAVLLKRFQSGRHGALFTMGAPGGRFMGTFRAGGSVFDATGRDASGGGRGPDDQRPELDA